MEIQVNSKKLYDITSRLVKVIDPKSPLEVMKDFYVKCGGGKLYITVMNSSVTALEGVDADFGSGDASLIEFCVDASIFSSFLKKIHGINSDVRDLKIDVGEDRNLRITYSSGIMKIPYEGITLFPAVVKPKNSRCFYINGEILDRMIGSVCPVVDEEETLRPILRYIHLSVKNGIISVIGASSPEMRKCSIAIDVDKDLVVDLLIDPKFYDVFRWYVCKKERVQVNYDEDKTYIMAGSAYMYQVNPSGVYPNCDAIMAKCCDSYCTQSFIVNISDFLKNIGIVEIGSKTLFTIQVDGEEGTLINERGVDNINIRQSFDFKKVEGHNDFDLSFNVRKFKDALKNLESEEIEIKKSDALRCAYFEETDSYGVDKLFLLMSFVNV